MAGLTCAKQVIDNGASVSGMIACAGPSVAMYASIGIEPTEKEAAQIDRMSTKLLGAYASMLARLQDEAERS